MLYIFSILYYNLNYLNKTCIKNKYNFFSIIYSNFLSKKNQTPPPPQKKKKKKKKTNLILPLNQRIETKKSNEMELKCHLNKQKKILL